jgi:ribonuclease BN (tRNA processing enzyme)
VRPVLHAPTGAREVFRRVTGAWGSEQLIERAFDVREYDPSSSLMVGEMTLRFREVVHFVPTHAVEIAAAGRRFVFSADTAPTDALVEHAAGADLLLAEATLPAPEDDGPRGHLTPREAGEHAARAGVGRLVLTHLSDELDEDWARSEAAAAFGGPVEVAREGATYTI